MRYNPHKAREAVQYLVDTPWFPHRVRGLRSNLERPRALPYRDEEACLNELLVIGRQNKQAFENLIALAEIKRDDRGTYQREFMRAKRARERKVIRIEELLQSKMLRMDERRETIRRYSEQWEAQLKTFLEGYGGLSWEERNAVKRDFWSQVDRGLDELLAEAERELTKEVHRKKRVVVDKKLQNPSLRDKLREQLERHNRKQ